MEEKHAIRYERVSRRKTEDRNEHNKNTTATVVFAQAERMKSTVRLFHNEMKRRLHRYLRGVGATVNDR